MHADVIYANAIVRSLTLVCLYHTDAYGGWLAAIWVEGFHTGSAVAGVAAPSV